MRETMVRVEVRRGKPRAAMEAAETQLETDWAAFKSADRGLPMEGGCTLALLLSPLLNG